MRRVWITIVLLALTAGLIAQFIWKIVYFPEPIVPVTLELMFIVLLTWSAIFLVWSK